MGNYYAHCVIVRHYSGAAEANRVRSRFLENNAGLGPLVSPVIDRGGDGVFTIWTPYCKAGTVIEDKINKSMSTVLDWLRAVNDEEHLLEWCEVEFGEDVSPRVYSWTYGETGAICHCCLVRRTDISVESQQEDDDIDVLCYECKCYECKHPYRCRDG